MEYTSRRILKAINSTSYDQENEVCDHEFQIEFGFDQQLSDNTSRFTGQAE